MDAACPPLKALLHIMAHGSYEGIGIDDPRFRKLFDRETVLASDWYEERLRMKQQRDSPLASPRRGFGKVSARRNSAPAACDFDLDDGCAKPEPS